jgi:hypothetical protein
MVAAVMMVWERALVCRAIIFEPYLDSISIRFSSYFHYELEL